MPGQRPHRQSGLGITLLGGITRAAHHPSPRPQRPMARPDPRPRPGRPEIDPCYQRHPGRDTARSPRCHRGKNAV